MVVELEFRFGPGGMDLRVAEPDPGRLVRWDVVGGPEEWIGTSVPWDLRQDGDRTIVLFRHEGCRQPVEFMHHCSTEWGTFLMSAPGGVPRASRPRNSSVLRPYGARAGLGR